MYCPRCNSDQVNVDTLRHDWGFFECANCDFEGEGPIIPQGFESIYEPSATEAFNTMIRRDRAMRRQKARR